MVCEPFARYIPRSAVDKSQKGHWVARAYDSTFGKTYNEISNDLRSSDLWQCDCYLYISGYMENSDYFHGLRDPSDYK